MSPLQVLTPFLSFLAGLWAATYLQDRDVRRRHLGIVGALRADVARVQSECDALSPADMRDPTGTRPILPTLSPWVQGLLADFASTSPRIVELFLDLELRLHNLRTLDVGKMLREAHLEALKRAVVAAERPPEKVPFTQAGDVMLALEDFANFPVERALGEVKAALKAVEAELAGQEATLSAGLLTHLPWH